MPPSKRNKPTDDHWPADPDERLRMLTLATESSLSAIGIADTEGRMVYVNNALVHMWGYTRPEELLGRSVTEFFDGDTILQTLEELRRGGTVQGLDRGRRRDESIFPVRFAATILPDPTGQPAYLFGSFVDISEQIHLQQELQHRDEQHRALWNAIPGMMYRGRPDWSLEIVSHHAEQITGYTVEEFRSGAVNWRDLIHPDDRERVLQESRDRTDGELRLDQAYRIHTKSGDVVWVRDIKTLQFANGQSAGAAGFVTDITSAKHMEEQLAQADRLATVGLMAAGVAHEMNNPLSVMIGYAELIEEKIEQLPPEHRLALAQLQKPLRMIHRTGRRCKRIVEDLLSFGEPGQTARGRVDLAAVLSNSLGLVKQQCADRGINLEAELTDCPPVHGNEHQLKLVFNNLLLNAVQSMPEGGTLRASTHAEPGTPAWAFAVVSDTGTGISRETLRRMFDPFFTTKPVGEGTGLGLSIVYGIVEQHGGRIDVDSTPGQGTIVRVRLPLATSPS